jgi:hypothetical protein
MKFVIRDDDACGFTSPDEIRRCYERIWSYAPVSLSVTPFRVPGNDWNAPSAYQGSMDALPLARNRELVEFIRDGLGSGTLDIALHGYHHWLCEGLPEFVAGNELAEKAQLGKTYLDKLFGLDIRTFVPPNNALSREGLAAIVVARMNLGGTFKLWSRASRPVTLKSLSYCPRVWWHHYIRGRRYPFILDLGDHKEVSCNTVGPRSCYRTLQQELRYCHAVDGVFVLATHYHAFERQTEDGHTIGNVVNELIDKAASLPGTEFIGFNAVWKSSPK